MKRLKRTMKKARTSLAAAVAVGTLAASSPVSVLAGENFTTYWSKDNAPLIYGAVKITMPTGAVTSFDVQDARFRAFARDFEDGDLTGQMSVSSDVDPSTAGVYSLHYSVTDSHNNTASLDVPVIISDDASEFTVERTVYNLPSWTNMEQAGIKKGYPGDRQMLGVYVPAGRSISIRVLESGGLPLFFSAVTNSRAQEDKEYIEIPANGSAVTLTGATAGGSGRADVSSVPAVFCRYDPAHNAGQMSDRSYINQTNRIEVTFGTDIPALDYYHYGDDEAAFRTAWKASQNDYAVVESGQVMAFVPRGDMDALTSSQPMSASQMKFPTLDAWMDYIGKIIDTYDEMLGLEYQATDAAHQNVRYKQVFRANAAGAGAAYHQGSHIGNSSASIAPLFNASWMLLHEIGHGFQDGTDNGPQMYLGEVSNNFLAHYFQSNPDLFPYETPGWLYGSETAEQMADRLGINSLNQTFNDYGLKDRLGILVNVFESLDGIDTYRDISRLYREQLLDGVKMENADVFMLSIARNQQVNVIPYFESFGILPSQNVREQILDMDLPVLAAPVEVLNDSLDGFVGPDVLSTVLLPASAYGSTGAKGTIQIELDDAYVQKYGGQDILVRDGRTVAARIPITGKVLAADVPAGRYVLEFPAPAGAVPEKRITTVKENDSFSYVQDFDDVEIDLSEFVKGTGYRESLEFWSNGNILKAVFDDDFTKMNLSAGGGSIYGGTTMEVRFYDADGNVKWEFQSSGTAADLSSVLLGEQSVSYGDRFEVTLSGKHSRAVVKKAFHSDAFGENMIAEKAAGGWNQSFNDTLWYVITPYGLAVSTDGNVTDANLQMTRELRSAALKQQYGSQIDRFLNSLDQSDAGILNLTVRQKQYLETIARMLEPADRPALLDEILEKVRRGAAPVVVYVGDTVILDGNVPDILGGLVVTDAEDGTILASGANTKIDWVYDGVSNTATAIITVVDSQGNAGSVSVTFTIETTPQVPNVPDTPDVPNVPDVPETSPDVPETPPDVPDVPDSTPDVSVPDETLPDVSNPDIEVPDESVPDMPEDDLPADEPDMPEEVPVQPVVPEGPEVSETPASPSVSAPAVTAPSVSAPAVSAPAASEQVLESEPEVSQDKAEESQPDEPVAEDEPVVEEVPVPAAVSENVSKSAVHPVKAAQFRSVLAGVLVFLQKLFKRK